MPEPLKPLVWINAVGLTPRLLAHAPRLSALATAGSHRPIEGVVPAVTCTAQATALTGLAPSEHGIVGNGWYRRELGEVRFWVQSYHQIAGETLYAGARRQARARGQVFTCAKLFWWFNQGAPVDYSLTPKPWYGADGSKVFDVHGYPAGLPREMEAKFGRFPFFSFWGPRAGLPATDWIASAAAEIIRSRRPTLSLVYLPHLDYDLQRFGPDADVVPARVAELDAAASRVLDAAEATGAEVAVFSEYGIGAVSRPVFANRQLRETGFVNVRDGPFGELMDMPESRAFAVCDHQVAHVYVRDQIDVPRVAEMLSGLRGVGHALSGAARAEVRLDHPRAGEIILLAEPDAWFAYPYWFDDRRAPDFARTVDIHRKPGYDPAELFVDPELRWPQLRVARRLLQKMFGFRYRMDIVPLDATLVRGSHGVPPADPLDGPMIVATDPHAAEAVHSLADLKQHALERMGLV